jgi:hypothetical protein
MKKSFKFGAGGSIGEAFSLEQKNKLKQHLIKSRLNDEEKSEFIDGVSQAIDEVKKSEIFSGNDGKTVERLRTFENAAHVLVSAINGLKADFEGKDQDPFQYLAVYLNECLYATNPAIKLPASWIELKPQPEDILNNLKKTLVEIKDVAEHLEKVAEYSKEKATELVSKGSRPADDKAKRIALAVTKVFFKKFGYFPPYRRGSWFDEFMATIGDDNEITISERTLKFAIDNAS